MELADENSWWDYQPIAEKEISWKTEIVILLSISRSFYSFFSSFLFGGREGEAKISGSRNFILLYFTTVVSKSACMHLFEFLHIDYLGV